MNREVNLNTVADRKIHTIRLDLVCVLLLPILFFAVRGSFSFEYQYLNNGTVGAFGSLAVPTWGSGSATHSIEILAAYGIAILAMLPIWRQVLQACRENKLAFALPVLAIISTVWSQEPARTAAFAIMAVINTLFAIYLTERLRPDQQVSLFLLAGTVLALSSLLVVALFPNAGVDHKNAAVGWQGVFPHKNVCAIVMISFLLPALCTSFTGSFAQTRRVLYFFLLLALIVGTTSRTGWIVSFLCILCVSLLKLLRRIHKVERTLLLLILPLAAVVVIWLVLANSSEILALLGKSRTLTGRTAIWAAVIQSIVKRPFLGFGYDAFWIGFKGEAVNLAVAAGFVGLGNAENGVLQLWLEVGLVGVAILLIMLMRT